MRHISGEVKPAFASQRLGYFCAPARASRERSIGRPGAAARMRDTLSPDDYRYDVADI